MDASVSVKTAETAELDELREPGDVPDAGRQTTARVEQSSSRSASTQLDARALGVSGPFRAAVRLSRTSWAPDARARSR